MNVQLLFGTSVAFSLVAWGVFVSLYVWPQLQGRSRTDAIRPLLVLHAFRFIGLSALVPGVVALDLPMAFAREEAYGDLVAAVLALLALASLRSSLGIALTWVFNVWGTVDLLNAFYRANASGLAPGQFGATFFIPTLLVPLLLITHGLVFRLLLQPDRRPESEKASTVGPGMSVGREARNAVGFSDSHSPPRAIPRTQQRPDS